MANDNCTHHWIIDSENVGRCRYCPAVRDFGRLLQREGVFAVVGRRGAEARKEVLSKRSAAAKELWQDPEYRVKQSAAMKGRCHKKSAAAKRRWQNPEYRANQREARSGQHHKKEEFYE